MRVLIVDDEYKVCQLIKHLVCWEDYGMEIIDMVNDGEQAFEVIRREKPDVVITDIRMPGLDGIQLAEKTKQILDHVFFVIVSGYSQFEYARQAVKLGVEDYLVKPIRKKDLEAVLEKISGKHKKETDSKAEKETLKTELVRTREKIKNNLLQDLLFSQENYFQTAGTEEIEEKYGCRFEGNSYLMVLAHLYENSMEGDPEEQTFVMDKMQKVLRERLEPVSTEFLYLVWEREVICLMNMQNDQVCGLNRQLVKAVTDFSSIREIFPDARVAVVIGRSMDGLSGCREYLDRMRMILLERFRKEEQAIFQDVYEAEAEADPEEIITDDLRKSFLLELELLDSDGTGRLLEEVENRLKERKASPNLKYRVWREIAGIFILGVQNYYKEGGEMRAEEYLKGFEVFYSYEMGCEWMKQNMVLFVEQQGKKRKELEIRPIRMAKKYINDHFRENLRLETVSREIGLNPAYFSSVFKKDTGQNFTEYVVSVRMENAKRLLTQTNQDVIDVAYGVGYTDVKYFSKLFKKSTSLTPTEYRKLYN